MPKAVAKVGDTVIAESDETILIEGNHYFPPISVAKEFLGDSDMSTTCHWKGQASYKDVKIEGKTLDAAAWYYHEPTPSSLDIVGKDYTDYFAFWRGVEVDEK